MGTGGEKIVGKRNLGENDCPRPGMGWHGMACLGCKAMPESLAGVRACAGGLTERAPSAHRPLHFTAHCLHCLACLRPPSISWFAASVCALLLLLLPPPPPPPLQLGECFYRLRFSPRPFDSVLAPEGSRGPARPGPSWRDRFPFLRFVYCRRADEKGRGAVGDDGGRWSCNEQVMVGVGEGEDDTSWGWMLIVSGIDSSNGTKPWSSVTFEICVLIVSRLWIVQIFLRPLGNAGT